MTSEKRSANMRAIKSKNTKIEIMLRKQLWHKGIRYRKNYKILGCNIDIAITKLKIAIFCDGDFWHGRESKYEVHTNSKYWNNKIQHNKERDLEVTINLRDAGWKVLRYWESDITNNIDLCVENIISVVKLAKE